MSWVDNLHKARDKYVKEKEQIEFENECLRKFLRQRDDYINLLQDRIFIKISYKKCDRMIKESQEILDFICGNRS